MFEYLSDEPNDRQGQVTETSTTTAYLSVPEFYAGKSVFITGGSGFIGKVILEKLLYSCKHIDTVYVLIRDKKGKSAIQRIQEIVDKPLFSRLKDERPQDLNKIFPVIGDINLPYLGISTEDEETLTRKVSTVFHIAANINFHEELKAAVNTNVRGTEYLLNLCHRMKNIEAFVHISTAFCNTGQKILEEKLYSPPAELSEVLKFLDQKKYDQKQMKALLNGQPNTYTFSKALAEFYVADKHRNIPAVIIRPSIVSVSLNEPLPGWVENWLGATGLIAAVVKGANRVVLGDANNLLDLIPVDYVANLSIVAAARCNRSEGVSVYNCCTSSCNPIKIATVFNYLQNASSKSGSDIPQLIFTESKWLLSTLTFLLQIIPAYIMDLRLRAKGKKPMYVNIQSKVVRGRNLLNFFTSHSWEMKADGTRALHDLLSPEDKQQFPCDPCDIKWEDYINLYLKGIDRFLMIKSKI